MVQEQMICFIPVKSFSRRLPGKNFLPYGKDSESLWIRTWEQAREAGFPKTSIYVIGDAGWPEKQKHLMTLERPDYLCLDEVPTWEVIGWAVGRIKYFGWFTLLQATSPLRETYDIKKAIELSQERDMPVTSVNMKTEQPNGAIYIRHTRNIDIGVTGTLGYGMPESRSLDIDTIEDYWKAKESIPHVE